MREKLIDSGAKLIANTFHSPWYRGKEAARLRMPYRVGLDEARAAGAGEHGRRQRRTEP